jgi:hypothetical protein
MRAMSNLARALALLSVLLTALYSAPADASCATLEASLLPKFTGASAEAAGASVASGDINGDGINDLVTGAIWYDSSAGRVSVVFGSPSFTQPLASADLDGTNGFVVVGASAGDNLGSSVAFGDVNGDGVADLVVGGRHALPAH